MTTYTWYICCVTAKDNIYNLDRYTHGRHIYTYIVPGIICSRFAEFDHKGSLGLTDFAKLVGQARSLVPARIEYTDIA